jgi:D-Tyr-tRNAtyr deacylase
VINNTLTSIKETRKNELNVSLFPNPTAGEFKLSVKAEKPDVAEIEIFDLAGKMVLQKTAPVKTGENQLEMNVSSLNEGIYMIKTRVNGMVNVSKLILR